MVGTVRVLEAATRARRAASSSARPAARSTASATGRPPRTRRAARSRRTAWRSSPPRSTSHGWNRLHGASHVVLRFANVYGPRQMAALEGGVIAIFLERIARRQRRRRSSATASQTPRLRPRRRRRRARCSRPATADGGIFNVGTGVETTVIELPRRLPRVAGRRRRRPATSRARPASVHAACSTRRAPRDDARRRAPTTPLATGPRAHLGRRSGRNEGRPGETVRGVDFPLASSTQLGPFPVADRDGRRSPRSRRSSSCCSWWSAARSSRSRRRRRAARAGPHAEGDGGEGVDARRPRRSRRPRGREARRRGRAAAAQGRGRRPERQRPHRRRSRRRAAASARAATARRSSPTRRARTTRSARHVPPRVRGRGQAARARPRRPASSGPLDGMRAGAAPRRARRAHPRRADPPTRPARERSQAPR